MLNIQDKSLGRNLWGLYEFAQMPKFSLANLDSPAWHPPPALCAGTTPPQCEAYIYIFFVEYIDSPQSPYTPPVTLIISCRYQHGLSVASGFPYMSIYIRR